MPEGVAVTKGQVVVRFDADELTTQHAKQAVVVKQAENKAKTAANDLEVARNKAASDNAKAKLQKELAELDLDKYQEGDFKAELEEKMGEIALADRDLKEAQDKMLHYRKLFAEGFVPEDQVRLKEAEIKQKEFVLKSKQTKLDVLQRYTRKRQVSELTAKSADAVREHERTLKSSDASVEKAKNELEAAEVTVKIEKSALARIERQLERCEVKAPQDGILVYSKERMWDMAGRIQVGAMVHFQQLLFSLPDLTQMQVKMKIHESVVKKVAKGLKAEIRCEAYPDRVLHGTVQRVATLASTERYWDESAVKEYITIIRIDDLPTDSGLKPGMTAEVKILVNQLDDVLLVPVQAVTESEGQHCIYVKNGSGFERRPIKVGENNDKFVEIKSGLEAGEQVALDARARLALELKAEGKTPEPPKTPPAAEPVKGKSVAQAR
jgi:HlyD family secretion protein